MVGIAASRRDQVPLAALFVIGWLLVGEVNLAGRLNGADVGLIAMAPFLLIRRGGMLLEPWPKRILIAAGAWFLAQVLTDLIRQTPMEDLIRGWAKILVFAINFISLCLLTRFKLKLIVAFVIVLAMAVCVKVYLGIGDLNLLSGDFASQWKYGYGLLCSMLCFLGAAWLSDKTRGAVNGKWLPFASAAYALYLNARNLFGLTGVASVIALVARPGQQISRRKQIVYAVAGLVAAVLLINIYSYSASSGLLGTEAFDKYEMQSQGSAGLLAGRAELFGSSQAIMDSPIIGHGSWARDSRYVDIMFQRLIEMGVAVTDTQYYGNDLIPSHSHLLGAWVEAGIVGAIFWGTAMWLMITALLAVIRAPDIYVGLNSFILTNAVWNYLFSPFANDLRVIDAAWLVLAITVLRDRNGMPRAVRQSFSLPALKPLAQPALPEGARP